MRNINLYMHISLDGMITNLERWMSYSDEMLEEAYEYYKSVDSIVIGGNTYSSMAEYWQTAEFSSESALERSVAKRINEIEKVVISRSLKDLVWKHSRQLLFTDNKSFVQEIEALKQSEGKSISVESGVQTWKLFLYNNMFDELWLTVHPVVAVQGETLFSDLESTLPLHLKNSKVYSNGAIGLQYQKRLA